ncbi:hypothetical protein FRX31_014802 [Thalictrum thalictroides]|uniref:Uncharacterized protein n=1 Tax=Thalictrum thalictroides TaxID=46969 RepID=A0A7J6WGS5_THATH|nr:hypothetical protein FRX31_014802 [Thalictrum thalictroides]
MVLVFVDRGLARASWEVVPVPSIGGVLLNIETLKNRDANEGFRASNNVRSLCDRRMQSNKPFIG